MYYLNLPKIPENLITEIRLESNSYTKTVILPEFNVFEIFKNGKKIVDLYSKYFDEKIIPELLVMKNDSETLGEVPSHFDIYRKTAINYIIDTGEKKTETVFFNKIRDNQEFEKDCLAKKIDEKNLITEKSYIIETNQWHCFNAQQAHKVKNIEFYRIVVCITLESNINFVNFIKKYNKYIVKKV